MADVYTHHSVVYIFIQCLLTGGYHDDIGISSYIMWYQINSMAHTIQYTGTYCFINNTEFHISKLLLLSNFGMSLLIFECLSSNFLRHCS